MDKLNLFFKFFYFCENKISKNISQIHKLEIMHMTKQKPQFQYLQKKTLEKQTYFPKSKTVLEVEYQIPDDQINGQGKYVRQISEQIRQQIKQMIKNFAKLGEQQRIPYQDVVFKNLERIFSDRRKTLPGSFIKAEKQLNDKKTKNQRQRVSIQIPLQNLKHQFQVEQQHYHNSDKNFQYNMRIVIKKVDNKPHVHEHPLRKYLRSEMNGFYL